MRLYIDTRDSEKIVVGLDGDKVVADSRREKAQMLLGVIHRELERRSKCIHDVKSIEVETGPGSFTGLRVGISVANALGWALGVRVNGQGPGKLIVEPVY